VITIELPAANASADASTAAPLADLVAGDGTPDESEPDARQPPQSSLVVEKLPKDGDQGGVG
jgi:hypothetical protein